MGLSKSRSMKIKTKSAKVNRAWLNDHVNDPYVRLAQKEGYRARAAYKLKEIDEGFGLIRPGYLVVDLGSAPGAWSQYLRRRLSPGRAAAGQLNGTIIARENLRLWHGVGSAMYVLQWCCAGIVLWKTSAARSSGPS